MKKFRYLLFVLLLVPFFVTADEVDYDITKFSIESTINEDGSVDVCEFIKQKGTFNGYIRDIKYYGGVDGYNADSLSNLKIYALTKNFTKGIEFEKVTKGLNGQSNVYEQSSINGGISLKMYNKTVNGSNGYVICYTLEDVVIVHNDVAEFYWNFIGKEFDDLLKDVTIKVNLKQKDESVRIWAHGPLYGDVHPYHENISYGLAKIDYVNPNTPVDVRMTFNINNVPGSTNKTYKDGLQTILKEEEIRAEEANKQRKLAKDILTGKIVLAGVYLIFIIGIVIYSYKKYDKERKVSFEQQYLREFPNLYGPEILQYLNEHNISEKGYSASIVEIIRKKGLKVEDVPNSKKDYKLVLGSPKEELTAMEKSIVEFLLGEIGNGNEVTLSAIKKFGKKESTAKKFLNNFETWKNSAIGTANGYNFYEESGTAKFAILILIFTILVAAIEFVDFIFLGVIVTIIGVLSFIYEINIKKRTEFGAVEYQKWKAFKRFLEDFGRFDEKALPEVSLWERYLVYAMVLGVADKLQKVMQIKLKNMNVSENGFDLSDIYVMNYLIGNNLENVISNSVKSAIATSRSTIASSEMSSGSGMGGGFSSGGGFGGGGGGGRGF